MTTLQFVDSIPPAALGDAFARTALPGGWGVMDGLTPSMRPLWGFEGGSGTNYEVTSGKGRVNITAVSTIYSMLVGVRLVEFDAVVTVTMPVVATGAPIFVALTAPYVTPTDNYKAELVFGTSGALSVRLRRTASGTDLATASLGTYTAGSSWTIGFQRTDKTTWRAKVWPAGGTPPASWTVTATDVSVFAFGRIGASVLASAGNTNTLPVAVAFDDFACTPAPGVRLDLNNEAPWAAPYEGFDASPPALRRAAASTLLRDGSVYPASAYDDRMIRFRLELHADDAVAQLQALAAEVDRPRNILKWQPDDAAQPVHFNTIRSPMGRITEVPGGGNLRLFEVELLAEPFALGAQQILAPITINNDPLVGATAPQHVTIPAAQVLGDVDTPAVLRVGASAVVGRQSLMAVRSRNLSGSFWSLQMEDGNNQTDTTEPGNDVTMSGTSNNYTRTTFATNATMVNRVTFPVFPLGGFTSSAYRGTYRPFLRYRKSVAGDVIRVRMLWGGVSTPGAVVGRTVTLAQSTDRRYIDLDTLVSLPAGADPETDGYSGLLWPASGVPLAIQAERVSGSGNLDMDLLMFVPADERLCLVSWPDSLTGLGVVDGIREMAYEQAWDDASAGPGPIGDALGIPVVGLFPQLAAGEDNRLYVMPNVGTTGTQDSISESVSVYPTYWPRYLYARAS
ncbi:hypothetical protein ACFYL6_20910 [Micromonospora sp. NPDC007208]|uniref:hypothetical protein n=1 Tax=Micromonospora sp. NPDC007208 TaxID=3364236 RepID=UPI003698038F